MPNSKTRSVCKVSESLHAMVQPWLLLGLFACCSCGADAALGQDHTVDASLWSSFSASVSEILPPAPIVVASDDAGGMLRPQVDVWSVDRAGVAQYASTQLVFDAEETSGRPQVVAVRKLDGPALVALQNELAHYRVFSWDSTIGCAQVDCVEGSGTAVLEVDLNGQRKTVTWPLYASGLPQGLEEMAQAIKDASSNG